MRTNTRIRRNRSKERGATLLLVTISLFLLFAVAGISIDLVALYVVRGEAQRTADAAALAGATALVTSGYTSGGTDIVTAETAARLQATAVANRNLVSGGGFTIVAVAFNNMAPALGLPTPNNPQVTVTVDHPAGTYFMRVFGGGHRFENVETSATAEVYNPSGVPGGPVFCTGCIKPILLPNSGGQPGGDFVNPTTGQINLPAAYPGGIIGAELTFLNAGPAGGVWYPISIDGLLDLYDWESNVTMCNPVLLTCGPPNPNVTVLDPATIPPGTATTYLDQLIHASGPGPNLGQDTILNAAFTGGPLPFTITGGPGNHNPNVIGQTILQSDSIATFPIYDDTINPLPLVAGQQPTIIGFVQMFIECTTSPVSPGPTCITNPATPAAEGFTGMVLNVSGCGANVGTCGTTGGGGGSGTAPTISGGGASAVPVRLITPPAP